MDDKNKKDIDVKGKLEKNEKLSALLTWSDSLVFFIVLIIIGIILTIYNILLGSIAIIAILYLAYYQSRLIKEKQTEIYNYIEEMNDDFDEITRGAVFSMPFPLVIISLTGKIKWYNTKFKNIIDDEDESLLNKNVIDLVSDFNEENIKKLKEEKVIDANLDKKHFRFFANYFDKIGESEEEVILLYGVDRTSEYNLAKTYSDEGLAILVIYQDNYDEVKNSTDEALRPILFAEIDSVISSFAKKHQGYARKYEQDKYLLIMNNKELNNIIESKFSLLDDIKEINKGSNIPATLSIGASYDGENPLDIYQKARTSVDIALGRGGDQAVVKKGEDLSYFGGKNKALEKRNKVKARVISHALKQLIDQSSDVFIMGHRNPDMDALGAGLGILEAVKLQDKKGYIVLNESVPAIDNIYNRLKNEYEDFDKTFIDSDTAISRCSQGSLVIVVDNHRKNSCECPELLDITNKIVLIDHHRRGSDYIKDAMIAYIAPYASSASEMVTEILFYMTDKLDIPPIVAEALLAGITVDTKNFYYQTGVRTFEAASILKRQGADSLEVKQLFRDDAFTVRSVSQIVANSKTYKEGIAIGTNEEEVEESILIAAQAADNLLNIIGTEASFVLTKAKGKIHISGRSLGKISVQLILEKIGGGGHLTSAGAQLDMSMEDAVKTLEAAIDSYLEEDKDESYID